MNPENPTQPKLSKSEQSRLNGSKSKGPKTEAGKQRAALNALKHANYADVNRSWLPIDAGVLSNESRVLAFRIFEGYCRQLQPQSDAEILLVKRLRSANPMFTLFRKRDCLEAWVSGGSAIARKAKNSG